MLPIRGETYSDYLNRVLNAGGIPYTMSELMDLGWMELENGSMWIPDIAEPSAPSGPSEPLPSGDVGPELEPLVTIHLWVYCYSPVTGVWEGPWSQLFDVPWATAVSVVYAMADQIAKDFCDGKAHMLFGLAPLIGEMTNYDWAVQSPLAYQMNRGI